jgi:hypothetical protein
MARPPRRRPLPSDAEALEILTRRRTRPPHRPAPSAGKTLSPAIKALEAKFGQGVSGLQNRWREIAGDALARHSEPVKLTKGRNGAGGVLELRVDGPAAALIQHQAPQIIARVEMMLGAGAIARLRIVQGPVRASAKLTGKPPRKRPPLDAGAEAQLSRELEAAPDGPLKSALHRLGREVLRGRH